MSYDLAVFDPTVAPRDRSAFLEWYDTQNDEEEPHDHDDPMCCASLRAWFIDMVKEYPAMNGPYASPELPEDGASVTGIGSALIYASFAWSAHSS